MSNNPHLEHSVSQPTRSIRQQLLQCIPITTSMKQKQGNNPWKANKTPKVCRNPIIDCGFHEKQTIALRSQELSSLFQCPCMNITPRHNCFIVHTTRRYSTWHKDNLIPPTHDTTSDWVTNRNRRSLSLLFPGRRCNSTGTVFMHHKTFNMENLIGE